MNGYTLYILRFATLRFGVWEFFVEIVLDRVGLWIGRGRDGGGS